MKPCVLITGASRGIGKGIATRFAKEGYNLIITCSKSGDSLYLLKEELETRYHIQCLISIGDIGQASYVSQLFTLINQTFGQLDILVNNAGISQIGLLQDLSIEDWNNMLQTNLTSVFLCSKYSIPLMLKKQKGSIINISSVWGNCGASCEVAYSASKGGMNSFTKALAKELGPSNIRVNAIACGAIDTSMNQFLSDDDKETLVNEIPLLRMGEVEEVADCVYQISTSQTYMTGQIITLDGGWCT